MKTSNMSILYVILLKSKNKNFLDKFLGYSKDTI
jgi:hypothetical protein